MELEHFPADVAAAEVGEHLRRHGYAIVDDLADAATMDQLDREVAPYIDASDAGRDEYDGRFTRRTGALIARCPTARRLVMHPTAVGAAQHLLSQATTIQLHLTQVITIAPGETQQKLHRDQMAFDFFPFPPDYHVQCNTMWALTDFTEENGGTHILPGIVGDGRRVRAARRRRAGDDAPRQLPVLRGQGAPRRRCESQRRGPSWRQHHVRRRVGEAGGEPIPRHAARDRQHPRRRPAADDGVPAGRVRARLRRRPAGPARRSCAASRTRSR